MKQMEGVWAGLLFKWRFKTGPMFQGVISDCLIERPFRPERLWVRIVNRQRAMKNSKALADSINSQIWPPKVKRELNNWVTALADLNRCNPNFLFLPVCLGYSTVQYPPGVRRGRESRVGSTQWYNFTKCGWLQGKKIPRSISGTKWNYLNRTPLLSYYTVLFL